MGHLADQRDARLSNLPGIFDRQREDAAAGLNRDMAEQAV